MLKAWLHRKVRQAIDDHGDDEGEPDGSNVERAFSREDPLTSAVFERLAYLEPAEAWSLFMTSCEGKERAAIQESAPAALESWSFWPRLLPGVEGTNVRHVEPDVLILWGDRAFIVEAKHRGAQKAAQWVEEIRAVRADRQFAGRRLVLVAAGGISRSDFDQQVALARQALNNDDTLYLLLRWGDLREVCEARLDQQGVTPGTAAILRDLIAALNAWGYRRRIDFESLPEMRQKGSLSITLGPEIFGTWSVK